MAIKQNLTPNLTLKNILASFASKSENHVDGFNEFLISHKDFTHNRKNFIISFVIHHTDINESTFDVIQKEEQVFENMEQYPKIRDYLNSLGAKYILRATWIVETTNIFQIVKDMYDKEYIFSDDSLIICEIGEFFYITNSKDKDDDIVDSYNTFIPKSRK